MLKFKKLISVLMIAFIMLGVVQPVFAASGTGTWVGQQYESNIKTTEYEGKPYGIYLRKLRNTATGEEKTVFCAEHGIGFYSRVNYNGSFYTVTDPTMKKACKIAYFGWYQKYGDYVVGDSNTWGYISGSNHLRYGNSERWTRLLAQKLGDGFEIIEEGLNSRTLISNDTRPGKEGKNGYEYLIPCLDTHDPIDLVVVMLGTNELKKAYNKTIEEIGEIFNKYIVKTILNRKSQFSNKYPKLLIVAPPLAADDGSGKYEGAYEKSLKFNEIYGKIAEDNNCYFVDNNGLETGIDKVHLTKESHTLLAEKLRVEISKIYQ